MKKIILSFALLSSSLLLANDINSTSETKKKIGDLLPNAMISKIELSDVTNVYKTYLPNGQILYVEPDAKLIIVGEMFKPNGFSITQFDTQKWQEELETQQIANLTPEKITKNSLKVNFGKGSSKYEFVIFTDPECPYCHKAEDTFKNKNATLYVNFMPLDFHKNAKQWSLDILSSKNPKETSENIRNGKYTKIEHTKEALAQLDKMVEVAKELNITGTPKLFIIDKTANKVVDVINGANIPKIEKYLK